VALQGNKSMTVALGMKYDINVKTGIPSPDEYESLHIHQLSDQQHRVSIVCVVIITYYSNHHTPN